MTVFSIKLCSELSTVATESCARAVKHLWWFKKVVQNTKWVLSQGSGNQIRSDSDKIMPNLFNPGLAISCYLFAVSFVCPGSFIVWQESTSF